MGLETALYIIGGTILGAASMTLGKKPKAPKQDGFLQPSSDPNKTIDLAYGLCRSAGDIVFEWTAGENNKYYYTVRALSYGEINQVIMGYMDDKPFTDPEVHPYLEVEYFLGGDNQNLFEQSNILKEIPEKWNETDRLAGVAVAVIRITGDPDHMTSIGNLTFVFEGKKVLDIRTGEIVYSTNPALCLLDYISNDIYGPSGVRESNLQKFSDAADRHDTLEYAGSAVTLYCDFTPANNGLGFVSTIDYENRKKLIRGDTYEVTLDGNVLFIGVLRDIVREGGFGNWEGQIGYQDEPSLPQLKFKLFFTELNGLVLTGRLEISLRPVVKMYTCNGIITAGSTKENLLAMLSSFNGTLSFPNGVAEILLDEEKPSVTVLDSSLITSEIDVSLVDNNKMYNAVSIEIINPEKDFDKDTVIVENADFFNRDGKVRKTLELTLPFTNDPRIAERIGYIELNKSRHPTTIKFKALWETLDLYVGDVFTLDQEELGWGIEQNSARLFQVIKIGLPSAKNDVELVCVSYDDADYLPSTFNERLPQDYVAPIYANDRQPPQITDVTYKTDNGNAFIQINWIHDAFTALEYLVEVHFVYTDEAGNPINFEKLTSLRELSKSVSFMANEFTENAYYQFRVYAYLTADLHTLSYGYFNYQHAGLPKPISLDVKATSPWTITATPIYTEEHVSQTLLQHNWWLILVDENNVTTLTNKVARFEDADLVSTSRELNYTGAHPGKKYLIWCQAVDNSGIKSVVIPGEVQGNPPVWVPTLGYEIYTLQQSEAVLGVTYPKLDIVASSQVVTRTDSVYTPDFVGFYSKVINLSSDAQINWSVIPSNLTLLDRVETNVIGTKFIDTTTLDGLSEFKVVVTAIIEEETIYTDEVTVVIVESGSDSLSGFLTSESINLTNTGDGYLPGNLVQGRFIMFKGTTDVSDVATFELVSTSNNLGIDLQGNLYTLQSVSEGDSEAVLRASYEGSEITKTLRVTTVNNGTRGSVTLALEVTGIAWSNDIAMNELQQIGGPVVYDLVTQYNASNGFKESRRYNGQSWVPTTTPVNSQDIIGQIPDESLSNNAQGILDSVSDLSETINQISEDSQQLLDSYQEIISFNQQSSAEYVNAILSLINDELDSSLLINDFSNFRNEIQTWKATVNEDLQQLVITGGTVLPSEWSALNLDVDALSGKVSSTLIKQQQLEDSVSTQSSQIEQLSDSLQLLVESTDISEISATYTQLLNRLDANDNSITQQALAIQGQSLDSIENLLDDALQAAQNSELSVDLAASRNTMQAVVDEQQQLATQQQLLITANENAVAVNEELRNAITDNEKAIASTRSTLLTDFSTDLSNAQARIEQVSESVSQESLARATLKTELESQLQTQQVSVSSQLLQLAETLASETEARTTQQNSLQSQITTNSSATQASLDNITQTLASETEARTTQQNNLQSQITTNDNDTQAAISQISQTLTTESQARAASISQLESEISTLDTEVNAKITSVEQTLTTDIQAVAEDVDQLSVTVTSNNETLTSSVTAVNQAVVDLESNTTNALTGLETRVSSNETNVSTAQLQIQSQGTELDNLNSVVALQVQTGGVVGAITLSGDATGSAIIFMSNTLQVINPATQQVDIGYDASSRETVFYGPVLAKKLRGDLTDAAAFNVEERVLTGTTTVLNVTVKSLEFTRVLAVSGISLKCNTTDITQLNQIFTVNITTYLEGSVISSQRRTNTYASGFITSSETGVEIPANSNDKNLRIEVQVVSNTHGVIRVEPQQIVIKSFRKGTSIL